ncbi:hypothetical protein SKAU_G00229860 [Synaphobranchus kaupii]|uniref:Ig-like domain-containing protein n=1 Tax=Synaphobranchus kaupii TaxID=118154 RepID=A0A9Q1F5M3_SYNKA|nr:hypothetical protein SKAU_G00229860 [Synaphobranchus kaupii]
MRMRPQMERTNLALSLLLLVIYFPGDAWGQAMGCSPQAQVKRNTMHMAVAKESLKITCPVRQCGQNLRYTWCRLQQHGNICRRVNETDGIKIWLEKPKEDGKLSHLFLLFGNISLDDDGQYRCSLSGSSSISESHYINVRVTAETESLNNGNDSNNISTSMVPEVELNSQGQNWIPYFSICTITVAVVVMVMMISFLCIYGYKGLQRSRNVSRCQYEATKDNHGISTAKQISVGRNSSRGHDNERGRCESSIIYVTLNQQSREEGSARTSIALEEPTEYATIRVS